MDDSFAVPALGGQNASDPEAQREYRALQMALVDSAGGSRPSAPANDVCAASSTSEADARRIRHRDAQRLYRARQKEQLQLARARLAPDGSGASGSLDVAAAHDSPTVTVADAAGVLERQEHRKALDRKRQRECRARKKQSQFLEADLEVQRRQATDTKKAFRSSRPETITVKETNQKASYRARMAATSDCLGGGERSRHPSPGPGERSRSVDSMSVDAPRPSDLVDSVPADDVDESEAPFAVEMNLVVDRTGNGVQWREVPFHLLNVDSLRIALASHRIRRPAKAKVDELRRQATKHRCVADCRSVTFSLSHTLDELPVESPEICRARFEKLIDDMLRAKFPVLLSADHRRALIRRWLDHLSDRRFNSVVCAVCSELVPHYVCDVRYLEDDMLDVLTNAKLPDGVFPVGYDRLLFRNAVLDVRGLVASDGCRSSANVCKACWRAVSAGKLPDLSLANDNYIGLDCVPEDIQRLFLRATPIELSVIARYRVKCTIYKFSRKKDSPQYGKPDATSQRYTHGNAISFTNQNTRLIHKLPPSPDEMRETLAVIFVGSVMPSPEEIQRMTPLLVRRHVVVRLLTWLKENNPHYSDVVISMDNLNDLLGGREAAVPTMLDVQLVNSEGSELPTASYVPTEVPHRGEDEEIPVNSHGVIGQSIEGMQLRAQKLLALKAWKSGKPAYTIPHGSTPITEWGNPSLFPCMFPHLFPWGLGGAENPERSRPVSLEASVRHLLNLPDRQFQTDNSFMYVAMNIIQKRAVYRATKFRVKRSGWQRAYDFLSNAEISACLSLHERSKDGTRRLQAENDAEKAVLSVVDQIKMVQVATPGSQAMKVKMRNEIRSLCHFLGTPTFFFTLNPADIHHPLFCKFAGADVSLDERVPEDMPTHSQRELLVARNPVAGAKFFNAMMTAFIDVLLGDDMPGKHGVFGPLRGFYGTIEAQGRGSLHCHLFVWIEGSLPPKKLREAMRDDDFKADLFRYLDNTIHTCLPSNTGIVQGEQANFAVRDPDRPHPCTTRCPHPDDPDFEDEYARDLEQLTLECHYHQHTDTCWKNNAKTDPRDDAHCRMRMDGTVREETCLDPETESILHRRWHPWINQHNRTVTSLARCNSDCKFIGSGPGAQALIYYATDYITKNDLPTYTVFAAVERVLTALKEQDQRDVDLDPSEGLSQAEKGRRFLNKACNALMAEMEISGQQCAMYLTSPNAFDHYTSHKFRTLYWASFNSYVRKLEAAQLEETIAGASLGNTDPVSDTAGGLDTADAGHIDDADEDEVVFDTGNPSKPLQISSQVDDYIYRGDGFEPIPLYWFVATVKKIPMSEEVQRLGKRSRPTGRTSPRARFRLQHPQCLSHLQCLHEKIVVPVLIGPSLPRNDQSDEYESYCRAMLVLFKPWRTISDLKAVTESWSDAFEKHHFDEQSAKIMSNMVAMHECKDARDAYSEMRRAGIVKQDLIHTQDAIRAVRSYLDKGKPADGDPDLDWLENMPLVAEELRKMFQCEDSGSAARVQEPMDVIVARRAVARALRSNVFGNKVATGSADFARKADSRTVKQHSDLKRALKSFRQSQRRADCSDSDSDKSDASDSDSESNSVETIDPTVQRMMYQRARDVSVLQYSDVYIQPQQNPLVVKDIVDDFHMNKEQAEALGLIANHYFFNPEDQLLMLVTGGAGTGKSYVVKGIERFFKAVREPRALAKSGPTGCASFLINAETIHYLLSLHRTSLSVNELCALQEEWMGVKYLIVDEVSMIGSDLMARISARLSLITGSDAQFGGLNMIFLGDLRQLPPVLDGKLWGKGSRTTTTAVGQHEAHGRGLWSIVDHVVTLTENHRQKLDARYQELVSRVGDGRGLMCDVRLLMSRLLTDPGIGTDFEGAPLITADKHVRDEWNLAAVRRHAGETGQAVHFYVAQDRWNGAPAAGDMKSVLRALGTGPTKDRMGNLPLVKGMKVMVLQNEVTKAGIVNGAEGVLEDITYELNPDGERVALCAYVRIPNMQLQFPGCAPGVVPIFPESRPIRLGSKKKPKLKFSRTQLPLIPAYAYTDYKVQGRTMGKVIVDLQSAKKHESVYVMLSRASELRNIAILRSFEPKQVTGGLKLEERQEIARLQRLTELTVRRWVKTDLYKILIK